VNLDGREVVDPVRMTDKLGPVSVLAAMLGKDPGKVIDRLGSSTSAQPADSKDKRPEWTSYKPRTPQGDQG